MLTDEEKRTLRHELIRVRPTSWEQLHAAAAWAAIKAQCPQHYDIMRKNHTDRWGNGLHIRTLVHELRLALKLPPGGQVPAVTFMIWVLNNQCESNQHPNIPLQVKAER